MYLLAGKREVVMELLDAVSQLVRAGEVMVTKIRINEIHFPTTNFSHESSNDVLMSFGSSKRDELISSFI